MLYIKRNARNIIQTLFFLYTIGIGLRFYYFYTSLLAGNAEVVKPFGVEAFLPISALLGFKQLILTGIYDPIHPAGLTIFLAIVIMSTLLKKSFCAYICPIGFVSEKISSFGLKLKIHPFIHYPLSAIKFILLGFFIYTVFYTMDLASIQSFMNAPYNKVADAKMLDLFLKPSTTTMIVVSALVLLTFLFKGFFCKYLCPYGALLGVVSLFSPVKIKRDNNHCINCKACSKACPMDIPVHKRSTVYSPDCMTCLQCLNVKANDKCLTSSSITNKPYIYALVAVSFYVGIYAIASILGLTTSNVTSEEYMIWLQRLDYLSH